MRKTTVSLGRGEILPPGLLITVRIVSGCIGTISRDSVVDKILNCPLFLTYDTWFEPRKDVEAATADDNVEMDISMQKLWFWFITGGVNLVNNWVWGGFLTVVLIVLIIHLKLSWRTGALGNQKQRAFRWPSRAVIQPGFCPGRRHFQDRTRGWVAALEDRVGTPLF